MRALSNVVRPLGILCVFAFAPSLAVDSSSAASKQRPRLNNIFAHGSRAVAVYDREIRFVSLTERVSAQKNREGRLRLYELEVETPPDELPAARKMAFQHAFDIISSSDSSRFLVCTDPLTPKSPKAAGGRSEFCGVISAAGDILFEFKPNRPKEKLATFIFSPAGDYAVVFVGEPVEGEDGPRLGRPTEIWTWEYPRRFQKHPGPWKDGPPADPTEAMNELRRKFRRKP